MFSTCLFEEPLVVNSRAQAFDDGALVDLSMHELSRQLGELPLACTDTVWTLIHNAVAHHDQSFSETIQHIILAAKPAMVALSDASQAKFTVRIGGRFTALVLHIGPGDTPDLVLTLLHPSEV